METLFTNLKTSYSSTPNHEDDFRTFFLKEQEKVMQCPDKRGRRWHPLVIRWSFHLYATSPKAYQVLKDSGVVVLLDSRTLRDYSNCYKSHTGFDTAFLDLVKRVISKGQFRKILIPG